MRGQDQKRRPVVLVPRLYGTQKSIDMTMHEPGNRQPKRFYASSTRRGTHDPS
jgi:hypothetical protein